MKLLPLWIIALLLTSPILASGEEVYSFVKQDFSGSFTKLVDLQAVYKESALKIVLTYETLTATDNQKVRLAFADSNNPPAEYTDAKLCVEIEWNNNGLYKVILYSSGAKIASIKAPEEVPSSITLEIQDGRLDCDKLGVQDFGVGTLIVNAIYGEALYHNSTDWAGGMTNWDSGYVTVELNKNVGFTWIASSITPALTLYVEMIVIISVIGAIIGAVAKLGKWI